MAPSVKSAHRGKARPGLSQEDRTAVLSVSVVIGERERCEKLHRPCMVAEMLLQTCKRSIAHETRTETGNGHDRGEVMPIPYPTDARFVGRCLIGEHAVGIQWKRARPSRPPLRSRMVHQCWNGISDKRTWRYSSSGVVMGSEHRTHRIQVVPMGNTCTVSHFGHLTINPVSSTSFVFDMGAPQGGSCAYTRYPGFAQNQARNAKPRMASRQGRRTPCTREP